MIRVGYWIFSGKEGRKILWKYKQKMLHFEIKLCLSPKIWIKKELRGKP